MKIDIGTNVRTSDGEEIGKVERIIIDPESKEVHALVVHEGLILTRDVVVPISLVQHGDKESVQLRVDRRQLHELPDFVERHYVPSPPETEMPYSYAPGSVLSPLPPARVVAGLPSIYYQPSRVDVRIPQQDVEITLGTEVLTVDGPIGIVDEVRTDPEADRISSIVIKIGEGLSKAVEVPAEFVDEVADDHVMLSLTSQQVESLPVPTTDRYLTAEKRSRRARRRSFVQ